MVWWLWWWCIPRIVFAREESVRCALIDNDIELVYGEVELVNIHDTPLFYDLSLSSKR